MKSVFQLVSLPRTYGFFLHQQSCNNFRLLFFFFHFKLRIVLNFIKFIKIYEFLNLIHDYYCDRHLTFVNSITKTKSKCKCKLFTGCTLLFTYVIDVHLNDNAKTDKTILITNAIQICCEYKKHGNILELVIFIIFCNAMLNCMKRLVLKIASKTKEILYLWTFIICFII